MAVQLNASRPSKHKLGCTLSLPLPFITLSLIHSYLSMCPLTLPLRFLNCKKSIKSIALDQRVHHCVGLEVFIFVYASTTLYCVTEGVSMLICEMDIQQMTESKQNVIKILSKKLGEFKDINTFNQDVTHNFLSLCLKGRSLNIGVLTSSPSA